ncbi:MAG TPA: tripartite tricarboxylate transporter substrate binding protein [Burkholderiales bacterium]|nr:tripartite tricarboxylate transporter substrate binding protein [Burkholderiales bacterium]
MKLRSIAPVVMCAVLMPAIAAAAAPAEQPYPARPVRIIVPFPPAGGSDVIARIIAQKLSESLNQTVVVDNRPGAGANIGIGIAAKAPPDGYTFLLASSAFTVNPTLYAKIPYSPFQDFQPLTCAGSSPNLLAVHPSLPAKNVNELVALIRSQPAKHSYSSPGAGTTPHLSGEMFRMIYKLDLKHVPYGGAGPQVQSMLGGQVPIGWASVPSFAPQVKSGQLRGLVVTADKRTPALGDVPSAGELGIKGLTGDTFQGIFARAGTPKPIVSRLHAEITKVLALPDVRERLAGIGFDPCSNSPEEFSAQVKADIARWGKVIRDAGITAN